MARPRKNNFDEQTLKQVEDFAGVGLTLEEIANLLDMDVSTLRRNRKRNEELCRAIKRGQDRAISSMSRRLYQAGMDGNVTAMIFFLKNRAKDKWMDVPAQDKNGNFEALVRVLKESLKGDKDQV